MQIHGSCSVQVGVVVELVAAVSETQEHLLEVWGSFCVLIKPVLEERRSFLPWDKSGRKRFWKLLKNILSPLLGKEEWEGVLCEGAFKKDREEAEKDERKEERR